MTTGLRRTELSDLEWGDVRLSAPAPFIRLRAEKTKARRGDHLAIKAELAAALRQARPEQPADTGRVFAAVPSIRELRADLAAADIPWHVPGRGHATFLGLRKTLGTMLGMAGVPERVAMEQMRLTDRRLLNQTYTDARVFDLAAVVEKLPDLMSADSRAVHTATGTDGTAGPATPSRLIRPSLGGAKAAPTHRL